MCASPILECVQVHMNLVKDVPVSCSITPNLVFLRQGFLLNLELDRQPASPFSLFSVPLQCCGCRHGNYARSFTRVLRI